MYPGLKLENRVNYRIPQNTLNMTPNTALEHVTEKYHIGGNKTSATIDAFLQLKQGHWHFQ